MEGSAAEAVRAKLEAEREKLAEADAHLAAQVKTLQAKYDRALAKVPSGRDDKRNAAWHKAMDAAESLGTQLRGVYTRRSQIARQLATLASEEEFDRRLSTTERLTTLRRRKDGDMPKQVSPNGKCMCGCGKSVTRRFLPGHDAKLKSRLLDEATNGGTKKDAAVKMIKAMGWQHFLDARIASMEKKASRAASRKANGQQATEAAPAPRRSRKTNGKAPSGTRKATRSAKTAS